MQVKLGSRTLTALALAMLLAGAGAPLRAQETPQQEAGDLRQEVAEALAAIRDYSIEQKDAAVAKGKELMAQLDEQMATAQTQANEATGEAQSQWQAALAQLQELKAEAGTQLSALGESSAEMWESVKQGFADTAATLEQKLQDMMAEDQG